MDTQVIDIESLADLDEIGMTLNGKRVHLRFGFASTFFWEGGTDVNRRLDSLNVLEDYRAHFADKVNTYLPDNSRTQRFIKDADSAQHYRDRAARLQDIESGGASYYHYPTPEASYSVTNYMVRTLWSDKWERWSDILAYLPVKRVLDMGYETYISMMLHWCDLMNPGHGTAGLSYLVDFNRGKSDQICADLAFPGLKRYPGFDWPDLGAWGSEVRFVKERHIRTINWLTILDAGFIDQLGGLDKINAALTGDCVLHSWKNGIIIQAGPHPEIGDVNQGYIPEAYQSVAHLAKPLRFENFQPKWGIIYPPKPLDSAIESQKWIARFD